jgi:GT2 family glycosyltransferase
MTSPLSIIIVTHNSEQVIERCLKAIAEQTVRPAQIILVDSGSADTGYLKRLESGSVSLYCQENIGFAAANNFGFAQIKGVPEYVLFMNPDTFLLPNSIESALEVHGRNKGIGALSGKLLGFDLGSSAASGLLDSTGVFRTWYGRWYDRGQGKADGALFDKEKLVPAICGAFMFCRTQALTDELPEIFDESFFMYKEDIDLCLRLRKKGWKLLYTPEVELFHARGWAKNRRFIDPEMKLLAAKNEIRLTLKHRSIYIIWAVSKYLAVRVAGI